MLFIVIRCIEFWVLRKPETSATHTRAQTPRKCKSSFVFSLLPLRGDCI